MTPELLRELTNLAAAVDGRRRPIQRWWAAMERRMFIDGVVGGKTKSELATWCSNVEKCVSRKVLTVLDLRVAWAVEPIEVEAFYAATSTTPARLEVLEDEEASSIEAPSGFVLPRNMLRKSFTPFTLSASPHIKAREKIIF